MTNGSLALKWRDELDLLNDLGIYLFVIFSSRIVRLSLFAHLFFLYVDSFLLAGNFALADLIHVRFCVDFIFRALCFLLFINSIRGCFILLTR